MHVNIRAMKIKLIIPIALLSSCTLFGSKNEISVTQKKTKTEELKRVRKPAQVSVNVASKRHAQAKKNKKSSLKKPNVSTKASTKIATPRVKSLEPQTNVDIVQVQAAPQSKNVKVTTATTPVSQVARTELDLANQKKLLKAMQEAYDQASTREFIDLYEKFKSISNLDRSLAGQGHYLAGLFYYATKAYGSSIQCFDLMLSIKDLHESDRVKAIFGKAQTFKKMNIPEQSVRFYEEIIAKYPASHEASRAAVELQKIRGEF